MRPARGPKWLREPLPFVPAGRVMRPVQQLRGRAAAAPAGALLRARVTHEAVPSQKDAR